MKRHQLNKPNSLVEPLTRRELEILALLAASWSNTEIAQSLSLAVSSVKWYEQQIYTKLGVNSRKQAVAKALELGILEQPEPLPKDAPGLPTGTITFLFTDIEDSSSLWEQMPEAMRDSVAQHRTILRQSIEANRGQVFHIIGDTFQAAFRLASEGVRAALSAQRALRDAQWGSTGPLKVRMGLHAGPADLDEGSNLFYQVGNTINRAARIMTVGHGGQILLSQEAADLAERELPEGVELCDLGRQRLKGMQRPEHLYQVVATDLPQNFQPLETGESSPHNLPTQLNSFIGREKEIASLQELFLIHRARLVTLTGSGGTGKTRLALQAAEQMLEAFPQGIWLVELAPLSDPALVARAVAVVLTVREDPQRSILQVITAYLHDRQTLLILDNCEHVVGEVAALTGQLLRACPQLCILATSREILGVEGETPFRCPSLSLPSGQSSMEALTQCEAVRLLVERVQTISPGFDLTETNIPLVARICQRLDGIPLAIELATARTRMLSIEQIAARLDQAFRLLTGGSRSVLPRHQTLKALIDWSYNLLSDEERTLMLRLSVFAGGWTLEAAEEVCSDLQNRGASSYSTAAEEYANRNDSILSASALLLPERIMDLLGQLIDKSLIQIDQETAEEPRYRMLETVRQYARERLVDTNGVEDRRDRHLDYFLALSLQAEPNVRTREARLWLDRLNRELDNFRIALEWSVSGFVVKGLRMAAALLWFWHMRSHWQEGIEWLNRLLVAEELHSAICPREQADWIARGKALNTMSFLADFAGFGDPTQYGIWGRESKAIFEKLYNEQGDTFRRDFAISNFSLANTEQAFLDSRQLFQTVHDPLYIAECDQDLAMLYMNHNNFDAADIYNEENLELRTELGDLDGKAFALFLAASIALCRGKYSMASELAKRSLNYFETAGNRGIMAYPLAALHTAETAQGDYQQANVEIEMEQALAQDLNITLLLLDALSFGGYIAWARKEYKQAVLLAQKALNVAIGFPSGFMRMPLYILGRVALSQGDYSQAREYLVKVLTKMQIMRMFSYDYNAIQALGVIAAAQGQARRAAVIFGAQEALWGWILNIICPAERDEYEQALTASRAVLGEEAFSAAWIEGRSMTEEQLRQYCAELPMENPVV